jgi:hypothetical protein
MNCSSSTTSECSFSFTTAASVAQVDPSWASRAERALVFEILDAKVRRLDIYSDREPALADLGPASKPSATD